MTSQLQSSPIAVLASVKRDFVGVSSMTFDRYAAYYDTLYQDKDYEAECDFLEQVFARYAQGPIRAILDLGCGTGGHALPLAGRGYIVTGVDCSETMLAEGRRKAKAMAQGAESCDFVQGDIRTLDLDRAFDAVIAMFAVISYQTTNEDLAAAFRTAREHLRPGGLFVFDAWFGPAVLTERPKDRIKTLQRGGERIIRLARPELDILTHTVQVNYKVLRLQDNRVLDEVDESHRMRYLFPQEIEHLLAGVSLRLLRLCPFMELNQRVTDLTWNVTAIAETLQQ